MLVYSDTVSTLCRVLTAVKINVPIAHVESGLRSFDGTILKEINRVATDYLSDLLFYPMETSVKNLSWGRTT
jgi:UDP-N-acetylglucosamine 2-epimerase